MSRTMDGIVPRLVWFVLYCLIAQTATAQEETEWIGGKWGGPMNAGGQVLNMMFQIEHDQAGSLRGSLSVPEQGGQKIPVSDISMEGTKVRLEVKMIGGRFEGDANEQRTRIEGFWEQNGLKFPLTLQKDYEAPQPNRPQEPKGPLPYDAEDVRFANEQAGIELAGTLTLPRGAEPFPAVVLISGSGAQDRDETVFGHRPFLVLADHLTRHGIAVLRYDDRGVGESGGNHATVDSTDLATDALAAVRYLQSRKEIDGGKIGLAGHSEGGLIAPMVASESEDVAFVILLAGTGVPGDEVLAEQNRAILRAVGIPPALIEKNAEAQRRAFDIMEMDLDDKAKRGKLNELFLAYFQSLQPFERMMLGVSEQNMQDNVNRQVLTLLSPWFQFFLQYDPRPALEKLRVPVLVMNGEKDVQVLPDQNLPAIEAALKKAGNEDVTIHRLEKLNHMFQESTSGAMQEYARIEQTFSPDALQIISDWIHARFGNTEK